MNELPMGQKNDLDYYFAFVKCKNEHHVDRCMAKRDLFYQGYHLSVKRLLPDSIRKCERLGSSEHIVIRLPLPGRKTK